MRIQGVTEKEFRSFDGTKIAYQDIGRGPAIVFANGLGGTYEAWVHMIEHLRDRHRILSWDYRGLYGSGRPRLSNVRIVDHVRDLEVLLAREKIDRALLVGWSMGTQVTFEFYKRNPGVAAGLVIICGSAGRPFDAALNWRGSRYVMPALFETFKRLHRLQGVVVKALVGLPYSLEMLKLTGMLAKEGDLETFEHMASDFVDLDFEVYNQIMLELGRHDARDVLPTIAVPTMIFTADGDFFTPDHVSEEMNRLIGDSRMIHLQGAGHYAPLEFPQRFNEELDSFLEAKLGRVPGWTAKGGKRASGKKPPGKTGGKKAS